MTKRIVWSAAVSERTRQAILARERVTRKEPESGSYRDLQERAKALNIPANQSREDLEAAIAAADEARSGTEGE